jgi:molecular chaperone Hsp33
VIKKDYLIKALDADKQVRVILASTTGVVEEAHIRHQTSATASAALGQVLTAALMMGSDLKGEDHALTLRVNGNGPAGPIVATVDAAGHGRALISVPQADLPPQAPGKLDVGGLVGQEGYLEVIRDMGLKQPFRGQVKLLSGEIAEDLAQYFMQSEQIPSLVALGVLVDTDLSIKAAGGLIIQAMPGAQDDLLQSLEENVGRLGPISDAIYRHESLEEVLAQVMEGIAYQQLDSKPLAFKCKCSRERLGVILSGLSEEELADICEKEGGLEITCNFCNQVYQFDQAEIDAYRSK